MADNKLAGLNEAENRDADTLKGGQGDDTVTAAECHDAVERAHQEDATSLNGGTGADTLEGGQGDAVDRAPPVGADTLHGARGDDHQNTTLGTATESSDPGKRDAEGRLPTDQAGDTVALRSADTEAKPMTDAPSPPISEDVARASTMGALNASPGAKPYAAPDMESQRTGPKTATVYRAPSVTRGSAINNIEVMWGELQMKLHDFDHDISDMPEDLQALVSFVKSRPAKA